MADSWTPADWIRVRLGDLGKIVTGKTPSTKVAEYFGGHIPFVTPSDMDGRRMISETERRLSELGVDSVRGAFLPAGAVMVSCIGSDMGKAAVAGRPCVTNQQINSIVVDERWNGHFVYYNLSTRQDDIKHRGAGGSAVPILNKGHFSQLEIVLPPRPEQDAIAHILGTLDDKIELNRRMNETLEAMARALFKSWFVDFDPVRAKMDGRQPDGMDKATADLFPDSFEDSALGKIPKGWEVGCVKEHFQLTMGQSPPGSTYNEIGEGLPFFQGRRDFGFRFPSRRVYCTKPTRFANEADTLVSVRAPVGDLNMAIERCAIGRGVAAVRHKTKASSYTYYGMHDLSEDFARYEAEGTVFGCINKESFEALQVLVPGDRAIQAFERIANPCDQVIEASTRQMDDLATLRDALLPKLLSGEIRVPEAEELVESKL